MALKWVPYNENGHVLSYTEHDIDYHRIADSPDIVTERYGKRVYWRSNDQFKATLQFDGFERGRSAAHAIFTDAVIGERYQMFLKDFEEMFRNEVSGTQISGEFIFIKRGKNYGIRYVSSFPAHYVMDQQ